jgi:hypothetical protein
MITEVRVLCRMEMDDIARNPYQFRFYGEDWGLISIHTSREYLTPETRKTLEMFNCLHMLSLDFWDVSDVDFPRVKAKHKDAILFNESHANQVIETIKAMHEDERSMVLIVHCDAGVSRSGAVGEFAVDFCNLDYLAFKDKNPCVCPNSFIRRELRKLSGLCPYSS